MFLESPCISYMAQYMSFAPYSQWHMESLYNWEGSFGFSNGGLQWPWADSMTIGCGGADRSHYTFFDYLCIAVFIDVTCLKDSFSRGGVIGNPSGS